jgi:hypothetical protein
LIQSANSTNNWGTSPLKSLSFGMVGPPVAPSEAGVVTGRTETSRISVVAATSGNFLS